MIIQENRIKENYLRNKSIIVSLKAELIVSRKSYCGVIGSLSENSIYVRITHNEIRYDFSIGTVAELTFQLHAGTTLNLACKVMWLYKTPNEGIGNCSKHRDALTSKIYLNGDGNFKFPPRIYKFIKQSWITYYLQ
jgi:hypothetical protein